MDWDEVEAFLLEFPDTEASLSWGMPGVKTGGTLVAWWRDRDDSPGALAFKVDRDELEALVEDESTPYFTIEHFRKFDTNAVLVRPGEADPAELRELLTEAWRATAKPTVLKAWLAEQEDQE
ncbi:MmcQ/YjbR family DNA-binding protein [Aeromicrobium sp. HA]|uniref:MmcQ/YjbR family DNA-binding protein n=1 Tax=Aeromicrobium sp. HA TaxID=3009077 RepID=UPI0022AF62D2|nr:MmcQ/YjbR family DNA-binding protein [Aeromicrobium sp. HA]